MILNNLSAGCLERGVVLDPFMEPSTEVSVLFHYSNNHVWRLDQVDIIHSNLPGMMKGRSDVELYTIFEHDPVKLFLLDPDIPDSYSRRAVIPEL